MYQSGSFDTPPLAAQKRIYLYAHVAKATAQPNRRQVAIADQTASRRSVVWRPRERPPRAVARLVPVPWLISIARPVKVSVVTPGIIARSIGTRRGSRRRARFLALRLRSRRRGIGRDCCCIVERLSRERILHCGSLADRAVSRSWQARLAAEEPPPRLRTLVELFVQRNSALQQAI